MILKIKVENITKLLISLYVENFFCDLLVLCFVSVANRTEFSNKIRNTECVT